MRYCPDCVLDPSPLPDCRSSLACLSSDKALMESNRKTELVPVSLIYRTTGICQSKWSGSMRCFPGRRKDVFKKKIIWLDPTTLPPGLLETLDIIGSPQQRGKEKGGIHPQQVASVLPNPHPQFLSAFQGLLFLYTSNVNRHMFYTPGFKMLAV